MTRDPSPNLGISRRTLLRRGAMVAGAVAWSTPTIRSIDVRNLAERGSPPPESDPARGQQVRAAPATS